MSDEHEQTHDGPEAEAKVAEISDEELEEVSGGWDEYDLKRKPGTGGANPQDQSYGGGGGSAQQMRGRYLP